MRATFLTTLLLLLVTSAMAQTKPRHTTEKPPSPARQSDHYRGHPIFLDSLPKKKADRLRQILDQQDVTKQEIDDEVDSFVAKQSPEIQEKYAAFKR
jgi:hypothetical protein